MASSAGVAVSAGAPGRSAPEGCAGVGFGASFGKRMRGMGVALPAAENIAAGQDNAAEAFEAWYRSPKHLANMLGNYRGLGVAVVSNPASGGRRYWAMVLSG